ncbi:threonine ammonia-lyase [Cryptosporangium phraense]|uniref:threonine ammonia-lyase n=1 Tax=Cryptosporangium phraense TaxID=2593070 RepID=A0A545AYW3_9ACTN|nr:threonine ammonia-lyase [Cryptosporangium phraense]TQS46526.1 threonine ammonia-lyase [Cryptosporangium phraense]
MPLVSLEDVLSAQKVLAGVVRKTPLEECRPLSGLVGGPAFLKCENLQYAGSFKPRGAYLRLVRLTPAERANGVVAASAGNHAQGVALAARLVGTHATVFMPVGASLPKVAATRGYGATVELVGNDLSEAMAAAVAFSEARNAVYIHPFDHPDVVAGQGTVGLEILEQCPDVGTVVVAAGGGGLVAGVATVLAAERPSARLVAVQAAGAAAVPLSLAAGHPVSLADLRTMADGIAVGRPGDLPLAHIQAQVDEVRTVSEEQISRALLFCLERAKMVVEPAGAAALAAVLADPTAFEPPVVVVLSGGNIDPLLLLRVIEHGMASAGRYLDLTVRFEDRPGMLAGLLGVLARERANVLDIAHVRHDAALRMGDVEVSLTVETDGPDHSHRAKSALRAAGYSVE